MKTHLNLLSIQVAVCTVWGCLEYGGVATFRPDFRALYILLLLAKVS